MAAGFEVTPEDMRQIPITDNHSRLVFCEQIKGFTPILREPYTVLLPRKGMPYRLAIYGRIVKPLER